MKPVVVPLLAVGLVVVFGASVLALLAPLETVSAQQFLREFSPRNIPSKILERSIFPSERFTFCRIRYTSGWGGRYYGRGDWSTDYPQSDENFSLRLDELTTPTLIIAGAADGLCKANVNDWQLLPSATLHVFSRVGHGIPRDVPDEFAEVIADFMVHGVVNAKTQQQKLKDAEL